MKFNVNVEIKDIYDSDIRCKIKKITDRCFEEVFKGNKVSFLYQDINTGTTISFNPCVCFYAASTIKILAVIMILKKCLSNELDIEDKILITMEELKQDTGIIKYQENDTYYTLKELLRLTIVESDNTAYLKLVSILGKNKIKEYGNLLGAIHTMEGKETDSFGIINAKDMLCYWKDVKSFIDENNIYSLMLKDWLSNPSFSIIKKESLNNKNFVRKYGSYGIAYHEIGYVEDTNPYYLMILTQLNEFDYKEEFTNTIAKNITKLHSIINKENN